MDPNIKQSIVDRLKQTNNVLVTVKSSPNIDQLAACIGLTLFLNKLGKHATAVFSGAVPSTLEFLKPESTLEKDTNSLRDFIISLDKSKADKLRYKVEDKVVKIFITPYRTSLSQDDLDFSQGDFNVDVVLALGVHVREELDQAIMAHGRILHDATVVSINNTKPADLGALNWNDPKASSLSEMVASLVEALQPNTLDDQMATAFLTGIVAETERFSNTKTSSTTMSMSAKLMAAGANQQLVATKLQEPVKAAPTATQEDSNGELEIDHPATQKDVKLPEPAADDDDSEIHIDEHGNLELGLLDEEEKPADKTKPSRLALDPPTMGGSLTANTQVNQLDPSIDPLSGKSPNDAIISHKVSPVKPVADDDTKSKGMDVKPTQTLSSIEQTVASPHVNGLDPLSPSPGSQPNVVTNTDTNPPIISSPTTIPAQGIDDARKAVEEAALASLNTPPEPVQSLNAQPLGPDLNTSQPLPGQASSPTEIPLPPSTPLPSDPAGLGQSPSAPPPVPPPMMPPSFGQPPNQNNNNDFNAPQ